MNDQSPSFFDRTIRRFRRAWRLGGKGRGLKHGVAPGLSDVDVKRLRRQIDACLERRGGEVSARARAAELGELYLALNEAGRRRFLVVLARDYDVDPKDVDRALQGRSKAKKPEEKRQAESDLRAVLVPPRIRLLSQFNGLAQGVKFLVDMRAELAALAEQRPYLEALDDDLFELLKSWFDVGFLDLERITWETPASLLEKLIEYEAVHEIRSWEDLKNRLEADRRCYAFFHPRMPEEPLIFVEVALVTGISDSIQALLDQFAPSEDPDRADTAIFYSISNCQRGLAGISFGSFLIKRVVDDLARELPNVKNFATLSPIPGFTRWLKNSAPGELEARLTESDIKKLSALMQAGSASQALLKIVETPRWHLDETVSSALQPILTGLCAHYLINARKGTRARDRVAHFHLSNGASIERINWLADTSERGMAQSAGMMVNYRYRLDQIERNHEAYSGEGLVTAASGVRKLI
ncbi:MAG TPA: malonyl-CoA decarboxylase [Gammaproteobacteria bacterium]|nr:malonyl-CoA decarboxylase [Gammaproteobacteria bacterium]